MKEFDDSDELLDDFNKRHNILLTDLVQHEISGIYWTVRAKYEIDSALSSCVDTLMTEPTWGLLLSMLDKVFKHVEGSLVAFITGSPASAEVIARTVVESAVNLMYILDDDRINRLFQHFSYYINQERKKLNKWENLIKDMGEKEADMHRLHINKKRLALDQLETFVNNARNQIGIKDNCLFCWNEIPVNNNNRLIEFLIQNFEVNWIKSAKIEKSNDNKIIIISDGMNSISLKLNNKKTKVNLIINDVGANEFIVKMENGRLNIYEAWPHKIADRFKLLGFETSYRTVYAALSSQTHCDAEDLLNLFYIADSERNELLNKLEMETINFSRLLMYEGVSYYIEATYRYAVCFGLDDAIPTLIKGKEAIEEMQLKIILEST